MQRQSMVLGAEFWGISQPPSTPRDRGLRPRTPLPQPAPLQRSHSGPAAVLPLFPFPSLDPLL